MARRNLDLRSRSILHKHVGVTGVGHPGAASPLSFPKDNLLTDHPKSQSVIERTGRCTRQSQSLEDRELAIQN